MKNGDFNNGLENAKKSPEEIVNSILLTLTKGKLNALPKLKALTSDELSDLAILAPPVKLIPIQFRLVHLYKKK